MNKNEYLIAVTILYAGQLRQWVQDKQGGPHSKDVLNKMFAMGKDKNFKIHTMLMERKSYLPNKSQITLKDRGYYGLL